MNALARVDIHPAPASKPQPMTFHDGLLYVGCWSNSRLYAIDAGSWAVRDEIVLPGVPYGVASLGGALHLVISIGEDDDRYLYRYVPGESLDDGARVPCPDLTGSHLATNGTNLFLVQQHFRRMLELDGGSVVRTIPLAGRCAGLAFLAGTCYVLAADDDFDSIEFATLDLEAGAAPRPLAAVHVEARGLAHDGRSWWTCHRELDEIVSFAEPSTSD